MLGWTLGRGRSEQEYKPCSRKELIIMIKTNILDLSILPFFH